MNSDQGGPDFRLCQSVSALRGVQAPGGAALHDAGGRLAVGFRAGPGLRPYVHPIVSPASGICLTEDAPPHHPWQHGLYIGLNAVNGLDFWCEGKTGLPAEVTGHFRTFPATLIAESTEIVTVELRTDYLAPDGACLLNETQRWAVALAGGRLILDLHWNLHARTAVHFGRYDYGGLFLRMPYRQEHGGDVLNSGGATGAACEGTRARWVCVRMPIAPGGEPEGFLLMDHPGNPGHPVRWRVDYQLGVGPGRCISAAWDLGAGEDCLQRYRLITCDASMDPATADPLWQAYSRQ